MHGYIKNTLKDSAFYFWSTFRQHFFLNSEMWTIFFDLHNKFHPFFLTTKKCRNSEKMLLPAFKCWVQSKSWTNFGQFHIRCFFFGQILKIFTRFKDPSFFPVLCIIRRKCCKNELFFVVDLFCQLQFYCHPSKATRYSNFGEKKEEYSRFPLITVRRRFSHGEAKQKQKNTLPKSKEQFLKANANCYEINFATKKRNAFLTHNQNLQLRVYSHVKMHVVFTFFFR